jgi:hypothetical protein
MGLGVQGAGAGARLSAVELPTRRARPPPPPPLHPPVLFWGDGQPPLPGRKEGRSGPEPGGEATSFFFSRKKSYRGVERTELRAAL